MPCKGCHQSDEAKRKNRLAHIGKYPSEETRKKLSISLKGRIAWNKGIPASESTKKKISESLFLHPPMKGKHHTEETKKKLAEKRLGTHPSKETIEKLSIYHRNHPSIGFKGGHHTEEARRRIGLASSKRTYSVETRLKTIFRNIISQGQQRYGLRPMHNLYYLYFPSEKINRGTLRHLSEETKKKIGIKSKGRYWSDETKRKKSESLRIEWSIQDIREKRISGILKALLKRPTSLEKQMINIVNKNNLPYKYVGDGSFLIGYKNPDFIDADNKTCIEVGAPFWHNENYEKERVDYFSGYGWSCIVFITNKLDEEQVLNRLGVNFDK